MKTIGLIGGTSWVSTIDYYRYINEGINAKLGGLEFARCIIHSLNFGDIQRNNETQNWDATLQLFSEAAQNLEKSGASAIVICANTMHKIADELQNRIGIPIIHIGNVTAEAIVLKGLQKVALLGTKYTMEQDFVTKKFTEKGIETLVPNEEDRQFIGNNIATELAKNIFTESSKNQYLTIIHKLIAEGAEGIVLGCTEIPLLVKPAEVSVPLFDTAALHAAAAVEFALG